MILAHSFYFKGILYVLLKLYLLLYIFKGAVLIELCLPFLFIFKLLDGLKMSLSVDLSVKKVNESGFENIRMVFFENYRLDFVSQLKSPLTNSNAEDGQNQILKVLISPQHW